MYRDEDGVGEMPGACPTAASRIGVMCGLLLPPFYRSFDSEKYSFYLSFDSEQYSFYLSFDSENYLLSLTA